MAVIHRTRRSVATAQPIYTRTSHHRVIASLLMALTLSACGGVVTVLPANTQQPVDSAAPDNRSSRVNEDQLRQLLLSRDDLGDGWYLEPEGSATTNGSSLPTLTRCLDGGEPTMAVEGNVYTRGGAVLTSAAAMYPSKDLAAARLRVLHEERGRDCLRTQVALWMSDRNAGSAVDLEFMPGVLPLGTPVSATRPHRLWLVSAMLRPSIALEIGILWCQVGEAVTTATYATPLDGRYTDPMVDTLFLRSRIRDFLVRCQSVDPAQT